MACIPIASQIVKETVPEFSDMSLDDIGKCFLSVDSACIGVDTDTTHTAVRQAIGLSTEDKTVSEGVVTYDGELLGNKLPSFLLQPPLLSNTKRITKSYTMSTSVRLG